MEPTPGSCPPTCCAGEALIGTLALCHTWWASWIGKGQQLHAVSIHAIDCVPCQPNSKIAPLPGCLRPHTRAEKQAGWERPWLCEAQVRLAWLANFAHHCVPLGW